MKFRTINGKKIPIGNQKKQQQELSEFLVKEMLKKKVPVETIIGGLRKAGVPDPTIKKAFDKNSNLVNRGLG